MFEGYDKQCRKTQYPSNKKLKNRLLLKGEMQKNLATESTYFQTAEVGRTLKSEMVANLVSLRPWDL